MDVYGELYDIFRLEYEKAWRRAGPTARFPDRIQRANRGKPDIELAGHALDATDEGLQVMSAAKTTPKTKNAGKAMKGRDLERDDAFASVWDAIVDSPEQAANLRARAELMQQIAVIVNKSGWTQIEAARQCSVMQPRMNDLLRSRVSRFSLDALVNIATAIGHKVRVEVQAA